jgi:two-component system, OmpR family, sensor histidine kinase KdpD
MTVRRGVLRVYFGAAPGVGKTYAMLAEGHRRADRGTDVVIGYVECHGRARTEQQLGALELIPRLTRSYRGAEFTEMDLDAILARRPRLVLVDELAHTNVPGGRNAKRWQDVEELLAAGISVITTVNVQHLESLNDVVEKITGITQRETVPDAVVRAADQIELVDMSPESLRRRMAHGNVYRSDKVDAALANYFRVGNLTALRELALLWLADRVEEGLKRYREQHRITETWETRERVVVALAGGSEGATLIRRAARIATRVGEGAGEGALLAVHIARGDGLAGASRAALVEQQQLVRSLGGTYHEVIGEDIPTALLDFARAENATQLVLGTSRRNRLAQLLTGPGIGATVIAHSGDIDVHMVTHDLVARRRRLPADGLGLSAPRRAAAMATAILVLPLLTLGLAQLRTQLSLPSQILIYLVAVVVVALIGGIVPAVFAAIAASLLLNYYFTPPIYSFTITDRDNIIALVAFLLVAGAVSSVVDLAARRARQASRAAAEADNLAQLATGAIGGELAVLDRLRETFAMDSVTLLYRASDADGWDVLAHSGPDPHGDVRDGDPETDTRLPVGDAAMLVLRGHPMPASDRRVLTAFAAHLSATLYQRKLGDQAAQAALLATLDRTRTALFAAVSHDLRSPLAAAKAALSGLRDPAVALSESDTAELLATADESLDLLITLVHNLLDTSRLQAGALPVHHRALALHEIVPAALDKLGEPSHTITLDIPAELPPANADPDLLIRIIVNLADNALRYAPPATPVTISASAIGERVELRVIDRGPGVPLDTRDAIFIPFQRLGDRDTSTGVGLGLALSRGLAEAMSGTLAAEDTPGGGLTMTLTLPTA